MTKADQLKRHAPLKERPYKNKDYLSWLHNQGFGCLVCGNTQIEIHHLEHGNRGRADNKCVILCPDCHRGKKSPHGYDAKLFYEEYPKDVLEAIAKKLFDRFIEEELH